MRGIDISFARPDTDGMKAAGAQWIARYFSNDANKNLTSDELKAYTAAGLPVVTVWEDSPTGALEGREKGVQDAQKAKSERQTVGLPDDHPIYFTVDTDATWSKVQDYFGGIASVLSQELTGVYGSYQVIQGAHALGYKYLWQTEAWSDGQWSEFASIRQDGGTVLNGGADVDDSEVPDFGQYPKPEIDLPLNDTDLAAISGIVTKAIASNRGTAVADTLYWFAHAVNGTVPEGDVPEVDKQSIAAIHAALSPAQLPK